MKKEKLLEGYRDPIYPKYSAYYYYYNPRANGMLGEHLFAGYPYYPKAY